jgi:hypothetical protein
VGRRGQRHPPLQLLGQGILFETHPSRRTVRDATFCVSGDGNTLELSGTNGQPLALKAGLRALTLTRVIPDAGVETTPEASVEAPVDDASSDATEDAGDGGVDATDAG